MIFRHVTFFALFSALTVSLQAAPLVAIDVGHHLTDPGAQSARGRSEFSFNREFAGVLAEAVTARGLAVREVNFDGSVRQLAERPKLAGKADFFIAIHHDSISEQYLQFWDWDGSEASYTDLKRGFGLFVSANNPDLATSLRCASGIGAQLRRQGFVPTPWHGRKHLAADAENGVWYYDNLVVLYRTHLPAVLFEAGVIKHREEELELRDPQRQARMAEALATAIAGCLLVTGKSAQASVER